MMNSATTFTTTNKHLENFLHLHKVHFIRQTKAEDGMPTWIYSITPRFKEVFDEYKLLYPRGFVS